MHTHHTNARWGFSVEYLGPILQRDLCHSLMDQISFHLQTLLILASLHPTKKLVKQHKCHSKAEQNFNVLSKGPCREVSGAKQQTSL
jgi:hypothetical protein